jgi:4-amino-4-deoxy-L-arabinose transferase-like glycosyltransferase
MWVMGLSARIFGVNSWSILAPQALIGVASVYLLYLTVQRWFGRNAALLAGAALALTPVAVLMFRYDNPDALLTLLLTAGAYTTVRAVEKASWRWLALTGVLLGFGFLTKMMQAFLVLPGFALVYLIAAPTGLGRRIRDLLVAGLALIVSAGWYVALVSLWPATSRPYIAGSTNNTLWELALGYNGLGRIFGGEGNGGGGGGGNSANVGFGGSTGIGRLFGSSMGTEISWLLPAALIATVAVLAITFTARRTDRARAAAVMWGGWLLVTGLTFSYMSGTIHPYYTVALAPAIAALVAIGGRVLWLHRARPWARAVLATMVLATAVWGSVLIGRADWLPALRWGSLALGVLTASVLLAPTTRRKRFAVVALVAAVLSAGGSGAAYAAATASVAHTGSIPASGPSSDFGRTGGGAGNRMGGAGGFTGPSGSVPGSSSSSATGSSSSSSRGGVAQSTGSGSSQAGPGGQTSSELIALLEASTTKWSAAISGATSAAELELDSGTSVIALGGWNGGDPSPTLAQFQSSVRAGQIHYYISGGGMGGGGGAGGSSGASSQIATWVAAHYKSTTVGNTTVYDLTQATTG